MSDAVATVVCHVNTKQRAVITFYLAEIKFAQLVGGFNQLGKMYIRREIQDHRWFIVDVAALAKTMRLLLKHSY